MAHGSVAGPTAQPAAEPDGLRAQREAEEEQKSLERILNAFRAYETKLSWEVARWQHNYERLPERHKALLPDEPAKYLKALRCVRTNQNVIGAMLETFEEDRGMQPSAGRNGGGPSSGPNFRDVSSVSNADIDKVKYVFKNLMRDWSAEGAPEREASYDRRPAPPLRMLAPGHRPGGFKCRILAELRDRFPNRDAAAPPRVLIPGAGLARLCVDIAAQGFEAEGNEHSWYMLIASAWVLNASPDVGMWQIHPWVHSSNNNLTSAHQLRALEVPDVPAASMPLQPGALSMCAGDFLEVYGAASSAGQYDCVVTCFFLDTAHNVIDYLEVIHRVLKPGGLWINLGPLLWHWSDSHLYMSTDELSIEVALEDVLRIAQAVGFKLLQHQQLTNVPYTANVHSMGKAGGTYDPAFWTMRKEVIVAPPSKN